MHLLIIAVLVALGNADTNEIRTVILDLNEITFDDNNVPYVDKVVTEYTFPVQSPEVEPSSENNIKQIQSVPEEVEAYPENPKGHAVYGLPDYQPQPDQPDIAAETLPEYPTPENDHKPEIDDDKPEGDTGYLIPIQENEPRVEFPFGELIVNYWYPSEAAPSIEDTWPNYEQPIIYFLGPAKEGEYTPLWFEIGDLPTEETTQPKEVVPTPVGLITPPSPQGVEIGDLPTGETTQPKEVVPTPVGLITPPSPQGVEIGDLPTGETTQPKEVLPTPVSPISPPPSTISPVPNIPDIVFPNSQEGDDVHNPIKTTLDNVIPDKTPLFVSPLNPSSELPNLPNTPGKPEITPESSPTATPVPVFNESPKPSSELPIDSSGILQPVTDIPNIPLKPEILPGSSPIGEVPVPVGTPEFSTRFSGDTSPDSKQFDFPGTFKQYKTPVPLFNKKGHPVYGFGTEHLYNNGLYRLPLP